MTSPDPPAGVRTADDVLFGPNQVDHAVDELRRGRIDTAVGTALPGRPELHGDTSLEVAAAAAKLLHLDLVDLLVEGWRKYDELVEAARRSVADPGATELVRLATHEVTCRQQPYVEVYLDGVRLTTVRLDLTVVFDIRVLVAAVKAGRIIALHSGQCDVSATLEVDGKAMPTRSGSIGFDLDIKLGDGIRLLPDEDPSAVGSP
jgi:hypothetical protein